MSKRNVFIGKLIKTTGPRLALLLAAGLAGAAQAQDAVTRPDPARDRTWVLRDDAAYLYRGSGEFLRRVELPGWIAAHSPWSCAPGLAVGPGGEAWVSSNARPLLWRIDAAGQRAEPLEIAPDSDLDKDFGFTGLVQVPAGPAQAPQGVLIAFNAAHGTLWRIDTARRTARRIFLYAPIRGACGIAAAPVPASPALQVAVPIRASAPRPGVATLCTTGRRVQRIELAADFGSARVSAGCMR